MSKRATFIVVHPDGTWQKRTTVRGRVYTAAIVMRESVADLADRYQRAIDEQETWDIGWHQMMVKRYREAQAKGQRYEYGRAEYRSDPNAAHDEAARREAKDAGKGVTGRSWPVYEVHQVPDGVKPEDLAEQIAAKWEVPF